MGPLTYFAGPRPRMHYWAAYRFLFGSPKAWTNLLMAGVCMLIPFVGPIVLLGYLIEVLVPRVGEDWPGWSGPGPYPDFDFSRFTTYLERGLWPFLVSLLATTVIVVPAFVLVIGGGLVIASVQVSEVLTAGLIVLLVAACAALVLGVSLIAIPVAIRAALLQEFGPAFSFDWARDFLSRTWRELLLAAVFEYATAIPLVIAGYLACFVGVYPAMALMIIAQWHLYFQAYRVYVAQGGGPVPPRGFPPPVPVPVAGPQPH